MKTVSAIPFQPKFSILGFIRERGKTYCVTAEPVSVSPTVKGWRISSTGEEEISSEDVLALARELEGKELYANSTLVEFYPRNWEMVVTR